MISFDGNPVVGLELSLPTYGVGVARLSYKAASTPDIGSIVSLDLGGVVYSMAVHRGGLSRGFAQLLLVQGAGGLSGIVRPRFYKNVSYSRLASDLIQNAGEVVGDINLPGTPPSYTRLALGAGTALRHLAHAALPGAGFWLNPDGAVSAGLRAGKAAGGVTVLSHDFARSAGLLSFNPKLQPGDSVDGRPVSQVLHSYAGGAARSQVLYG